MRLRSKRAAVAAAILIAMGGGLAAWWLSRPSPALRLVKTDFAAVSGWAEADAAPGLAAFKASCGEILTRSPTAAFGAYGGTAGDWFAVCRAASAVPPAGAKAFFERAFVPFAARGKPGLFTGYYEPEIAASHTRTGAFQTPVYGRPSDLVEVDLGAFRPALKGERIAGTVAGGKLVAFADRAAIEDKGLATAPVLFYVADPVDLFFLQIQGSGRANFPDGSVLRVAYDGQNGWPYTAIGKLLIAKGALTKAEMSLPALKGWLRAHPAEAKAVMQANRSYVFFKLLPQGDPALGAVGGEAVALTAGASLAVDSKFHGYGVPLFVATRAQGQPLQRLMVAQDRGGAIRGAIRADIYFGVGAKAEALAGTMKAPGTLVVLLPRPLADRMAAATDIGTP